MADAAPFSNHRRRYGEEQLESGMPSPWWLSGGGAKIVDLMEVLRKSLSKNAVVTRAYSGPPISLAERRAQRAAQTAPKKKTRAKRGTRTKSAAKARHRRA